MAALGGSSAVPGAAAQDADNRRRSGRYGCAEPATVAPDRSCVVDSGVPVTRTTHINRGGGFKGNGVCGILPTALTEVDVRHLGTLLQRSAEVGEMEGG